MPKLGFLNIQRGISMKKSLYTTGRDIIAFHDMLVKEKNEYPSFSNTLQLMKEQGLLSENPLPLPEITGLMSKEEFEKAYNEIPVDAGKILNTKTMDLEVHESFIFPKGRDVFCVQHIHNFGTGEQYVNKFFEITYVYKGGCSFFIGDETLKLKEGDICIITPDTAHDIQPFVSSFAFEAIIRESTFNSLFNELLTDNSVLSEFFRSSILKKEHKNYCIIHTDPEDTELTFYFQSFTAECIRDNVYANTCAISLIKLLLARSFRKYGDDIRISGIDFKNARPDAQSILQYIRNNYQNVTLSSTAEYFHYNKSYLSRFIHDHFQKSFLEIVTDLKIDSAKHYLRNSGRKITDIASLAGYESADHFSRSFKQHEGISPSVYRKQHR